MIQFILLLILIPIQGIRLAEADPAGALQRAPTNAVDCHTSDVPGGVTITADDGSQLVRPSILPTLPDISRSSLDKPLDESPCAGPVGDPILQRETSELPWESVVEKTFVMETDSGLLRGVYSERSRRTRNDEPQTPLAPFAKGEIPPHESFSKGEGMPGLCPAMDFVNNQCKRK